MDFERLLCDGRLVAIITRQELTPATGEGGVIFPPTYQDENSAEPTYNISDFGNGRNVCTIDSVASQINRLEKRFATESPYRDLVPHVIVKARISDKKVGIEHERYIDVLEAPHRLADATIRFAKEMHQKAKEAFLEFQKGNADPIARLSPMSLLFGAWDSHITGVKIPRAFMARIEAQNVHLRVRRGYYIAKLPAAEINLETGKAKTLSTIGLDNAGAKGLDGVVADGSIFREAIGNLIALRDNCRSRNEAEGTAIRRYILGLLLVAQTMPVVGFLRQGCILVTKGRPESYLRLSDGTTELFSLTHEEALSYAKDQAAAFGVDTSEKFYEFSPELAKDALRKRTEEPK
jgi:CRISPR-associated protein Csb1